MGSRKYLICTSWCVATLKSCLDKKKLHFLISSRPCIPFVNHRQTLFCNLALGLSEFTWILSSPASRNQGCRQREVMRMRRLNSKKPRLIRESQQGKMEENLCCSDADWEHAWGEVKSPGRVNWWSGCSTEADHERWPAWLLRRASRLKTLLIQRSRRLWIRWWTTCRWRRDWLRRERRTSRWRLLWLR